MLRDRIRTFLFGKTLILSLAAGLFSGTLCALLTETPTAQQLLDGFFHGLFPRPGAAHTAQDLLFCLFPVLLFYAGAHSLWARYAGGAILFFRGALSGYGCTAYFSAYGKEKIAPFGFFILTEWLTLLFYHSTAKLSCDYSDLYVRAGAFSGAKKGKKLRRRYTADVLFFTGMLFLFYLLRGCAVLLLQG